DVINLDRATLLAYNAAQEKTFVTSDSDKFHISLDRPQSHELFDRLEKDGLQDALKATRDAAWVQGLKAAFASLPPVNVKIAPAVTELAPEYLLRQALGAGKETRALPALDAD